VNWSKYTKELLATHEAFRRLQFPSASLFVVLNGPQVLFQARHNDKDFTVSIGLTNEPETLQEEWVRAVEWWNKTASEDDRSAIYQSSFIRTRASALIPALIKKGMYPVIQN
jgi:hypothetical protein